MSEQLAYARLEHILAPLVAKGKERNRDENLEYNVLSSLREYLCLDIIRPEFTTQKGLRFISLFMEMMELLKNVDDDHLPIAILRTILTPGNLLTNNMKKAKEILKENTKENRATELPLL